MKALKIILIVLLVLFLGGFIIFNIFSNKIVSESEKLDFQTIDLENIEDGQYQGSYTIQPVEVTVNTHVENGQISKIDIIDHFNGLGSKAETITDDIIERQEIEVDNISGATVSSIAIKKAVEDSLINN